MLLLTFFSVLLTSARAADYYLTVAGAGVQDGSSWANALSASQLATVHTTTMVDGDTLYLGSGDYGNRTISLTTSGSAGRLKRIVGVDTGSGIPIFDSANWTRTNPDAGQYSIISLGVGVSHWEISNLALRNCQFAVRATTSTSDRKGLVFRNLDIQLVRHGFYLSDCDDMTIEDCAVTNYTKHAYRLDQGCDNVVFSNNRADLSAGDVTWWDYSEPFPFGFIVNNSGVANTGILFLDCTANNNRRNNQNTGYWNGDGFVVEDNAVGVDFIGCIAVNNEDGGYDIKAAATFTNCVAVRNYQGFRLWDTAKTMTNCVATYPFRRSDTNPSGSESGNCIWLRNSAATLDYVTTHGNAGYGVREEGTGTATLTNSIVSFSGETGSFTLGSATLGIGTVTYRPGAGTNPSYVNPVSTWDGTGTDMDSQTYGPNRGYNSAGSSAGGGDEIIVNNTDSSGVTITGDWTASTYTAGYYDTDYLHDGNVGKGAKSVRFTPTISTAGSYDVFMIWTSATNRATNVPVDIVSASGTTTLLLDQTVNGGQWVSLGAYDFDSGTTGSVLVRTTGTNGFVIADAVGFVGAAPPMIASPAKIINSLTSKSLRPYNAGTGNNVGIVQYAYNSTWTSQHWTITDLGNTYYSIRNVYTGKSLRPLNASTAPGASIVQYDYDSSWQSEQWELIPAGAGYYGIRNRYSGLALRPLNAGTGNDVQIVQETYNASDASMKWLIAAP